MPTIYGVIHGATIELEREPGLPAGQRIAVDVRPSHEPPAWLERFVVDADVSPGKFVIKGTRLRVDDLVELVDDGRSDEDRRRTHPQLSAADLDAVRNYARVPEGMRRSFGGWAEDAEELDEYLDWTRQRRELRRHYGKQSGMRRIFDFFLVIRIRFTLGSDFSLCPWRERLKTPMVAHRDKATCHEPFHDDAATSLTQIPGPSEIQRRAGPARGGASS